MMSPPSTNTRWCPTTEQLMLLEELYRRGLRTPTAAQIQKITAHLSLHGKIQGKNVFYWFQNHKARDRQKLRRKIAYQHHRLNQFLPFSSLNHHFQPQGTGGCDEAPDFERMSQTWKWDPPKDGLMRSYGRDSSSMVIDVGPTLPSKPLQTLQLFPLTSANHHKIIS